MKYTDLLRWHRQITTSMHFHHRWNSPMPSRLKTSPTTFNTLKVFIVALNCDFLFLSVEFFFHKMIAGIDIGCLNILEWWGVACFRREGDLYGTRKRKKTAESTNHNVLFNYRTQKVDWVHSKQVTIVLVFEWELSVITRWALRSMGYIFLFVSSCCISSLFGLWWRRFVGAVPFLTTFVGNGRSRSWFVLLHWDTLLVVCRFVPTSFGDVHFWKAQLPPWVLVLVCSILRWLEVVVWRFFCIYCR